jgi:hypothetical protein
MSVSDIAKLGSQYNFSPAKFMKATAKGIDHGTDILSESRFNEGMISYTRSDLEYPISDLKYAHQKVIDPKYCKGKYQPSDPKGIEACKKDIIDSKLFFQTLRDTYRKELNIPEKAAKTLAEKAFPNALVALEKDARSIDSWVPFRNDGLITPKEVEDYYGNYKKSTWNDILSPNNR